MHSLNQAESLEQAFCDAMDEQGPVVIMGIEFDRSQILKEMDPIAYDTELVNFFDAMGFDPDADNEPDVDEATEWADFDADC